MSTRDEIQTAIDAVKADVKTCENELADARANVDRLEQQAADLARSQSALEDALAALNGQTTSAKRKPASSKKPSGRTNAKRRTTKKVTTDRLVAAIDELGGKTNTKALKEQLRISDGRALTGARTQAVRDGLIEVQGDTYTRLKASTQSGKK